MSYASMMRGQCEACRKALQEIHDLLGASTLTDDQQTVTEAWLIAKRALTDLEEALS